MSTGLIDTTGKVTVFNLRKNPFLVRKLGTEAISVKGIFKHLISCRVVV